IEYAAKRESRRLGPIRAAIVPGGTWAKWDRDRLAQSGGSHEQYKRPCLIGDLGFKATMPLLREVAS
ncbi:MAG TPA: GH3 auxin-responsive promoter family protein, partial [Gemmataceae bacterium]